MALPSQTTIRIGGMVCSNCEIAIERALLAVPGVRRAQVELAKGHARIEHDGRLDEQAVAAALQGEGYTLGAVTGAHIRRRFVEAGVAIIIILALFLGARQLGWPKGVGVGVGVSESMSLGFVFVIGLVASVSSCMAVTGGLLVALAAKYSEATAGLNAMQRFEPHLWFNLGRILSYAAFGALIGGVGSVLAPSPFLSGALTIGASILMMAVGLQMLGLLPRFSRLLPVIPTAARHRIHGLAVGHSRAGAALLGAATFFLPCGFTLALQLYVLGKADAGLGALTMLVFALGTLPALLGLSMLSSLAKGALQARFLTLAGAAVLMLGLMNVQYGLVQLDQRLPEASVAAPVAQPAMARQVVEMTVDGLEYRPNRFVVRAGSPVEWRIDAREAEGCGRILVSRALGVQKFLSATETNVITFTPQQAGEYAFNCGMGMMTPNSGFSVVN
jgi:sulfite exporter TauE/SafE/copper chaperone CopZ